MYFSEIVERIWGVINPPDKEPPKVLLSSGIDNATLTIPVTGSIGFPEGYLLSQGNVIEIAYELVLVSAYNETTQNITAELRGYRQTGQDNHAAGEAVYLSVRIPKYRIFQAIAGAVPFLASKLPYVQTIEVASGHVFPERVRDIIRISDTNTASYHYDYSLGFTPNGDILHVLGSEASYYVTYSTEPIAPTAPSQTLASANLEDGWSEILYWAGIGNILTSPDIERINVRSLAESLDLEIQDQRAPGVSLANAIRRRQDELVNEAMTHQRQLYSRQMHIKEAL